MIADGSDLDATLDRACADGRMSTGDADEVRTFAAFLTAAGPATLPDGAPDPDRSKRVRVAYAEHYPEDYARALAEHQARQEARA